MRLRSLACARRTADRDDHELTGVDEPLLYGGEQCQRGDGRVTTRYGDPARTAELVPLTRELREPVRPRAGMLAAVELDPRLGLGQPEVRAAVDHGDVLAEL